jgi:hypothetical protein
MTRTHLGMAFLLATCVPALAATPGVTTIANPGGGTIAYAQLPQQHTAQGAMGKVLQYVESNFGARPTIGKYMKSPDGNSLAATFTVTNGGTAIAGLALVAVSATGPGAGAVLSDTEDHLRTSLKPWPRAAPPRPRQPLPLRAGPMPAALLRQHPQPPLLGPARHPLPHRQRRSNPPPPPRSSPRRRFRTDRVRSACRPAGKLPPRARATSSPRARMARG